MDKILHDLMYLNYGIYGTILYWGHAEFCPSTVVMVMVIVIGIVAGCRVSGWLRTACFKRNPTPQHLRWGLSLSEYSRDAGST